MATTIDDIKAYLDEGKRRGATHVIIVCDSFSYEDYPKFVMPGEDARAIVAEYAAGKHSMQRVMEVYSLRQPLEPQLNEHRSFHCD